MTFNRLDRKRKVGSIGLPQWGVQIRIVDEHMQEVKQGEPGELVFRGHSMLKCYYRNPDATAKALRGGWFHTADVATVDTEGYYTIVDRLNDMIIRGGFNVYSREIEEQMIEHPDISLVAVIGVPDEKYGEEVAAYVTLLAGATISAEEIIEWTKARIARHKYPRSVTIVDSLPLSATGKILKRELRKR